MGRAVTPIALTEEQVLWFRARRGHLAGPGAKDAVVAARALVGAQAQQLPPALLALSQRTKGRPTAAELTALLLEDGQRKLVRTWGQRDTLHIYDPATDWSDVVAARATWQPGGRGGPMPTKAAVDKAQVALEAAGAPLSRRDLLPITPRGYIERVAPHVESNSGSRDGAPKFAAGRLIWSLANRGDVCVAGKLGSEQTYAPRSHWFPDVPWPDRVPESQAAALRLARHYLSTYGPATPQDMAHFFNAKVTVARAWLDVLTEAAELVDVSCGDRKRLVALKPDGRALKAVPPKGLKTWPVRLLPLWDSMLMGHADKSWTLPDEVERKRVWRRAAFVAAVVLARGRVVAIWSQKARARALDVSVEPLSGWRPAHAAGVRREAKAVASHLGLGAAEVTIA